MTTKPSVSTFLTSALSLSASFAPAPIKVEGLVSVKRGESGKMVVVTDQKPGNVSTASKAAINGMAATPEGFLQGGAKAPVVAPVAAPVKVADLDPQAFLLKIRDAGKRRNEAGLPCFSPDGEKEDQREALARFGGYSPGQPLGVQLDGAVRKARHALKLGGKGHQSQSDKRSALKSVAGFVAGAVDAGAVQRADIERRLRHAVTASFVLVLAVDATERGERLGGELLAKLRDVNPDLASLCESHGSSGEALEQARLVARDLKSALEADLASLS